MTPVPADVNQDCCNKEHASTQPGCRGGRKGKAWILLFWILVEFVGLQVLRWLCFPAEKALS